MFSVFQKNHYVFVCLLILFLLVNGFGEWIYVIEWKEWKVIEWGWVEEMNELFC